jgi:[acyl-carrier-protein] S-malonyltransferase
VIRAQLVAQVTGMVRWRESVLTMIDLGVEGFAELGGKVVGPMIKRISAEVAISHAGDMDSIEALAKEL